MKLIPKSKVPNLTVSNIEGGQWSLADQKPENFLMLIFYRGHHCPICKKYLETLNDLVDDASKLGVKVAAISGDPRERAIKSHEEWNVSNFEIGYGMTEAQMTEWGLYVSEAIKEGEPDVFGEPGLFLIDPDQTLYYAAYNSMPMGRPGLEEVLDFVEFILEKDYPARGEKTSPAAAMS